MYITCTTAEQKDRTQEDLDEKLNKLNEILVEKRAFWTKLKSKEWVNKYCDNKFVTYLNPPPVSEESKSSNDGINQQNDRMEAQKPKSKQHKRRVSLINDYSIGTRYYYDDWNYYRENQHKLKIESSLIIRGSHYTNLKTEMIQSNAISIDEWVLLEL